MRAFLPYGRQLIEDDDIAAVAEALREPFLTTGPRVEAFEAALCDATGAEHVVACNSGTAALHLACLALDLGPGDQAIVPSITFLATANAPRLVGAEVVFADVDPDSGLMTTETFAEALRRAPSAKAVLPVHLNGSFAPMAEIGRLATERGLAVIEDACHALGTTYRAEGQEGRVGDGRFGELAAFSFHPVKAVTTGEGGAVAARDGRLAERMRRLRSHGLTRNREDFRHPDGAFDADGTAGPWYYEMHEPGLNYRIPDVLCALGISQLAKLDRFLRRRRQLAARYDRAIGTLGDLVRPAARPANCVSAFHLYPVLIDFEACGVSRTVVTERLSQLGIGTQVHYIPVHRQPYYRRRGGAVDLPGADAYYDRVLSLPIHPAMADDDVDRVLDALAGVLGLSRRMTLAAAGA
jgi:UDP-4-amino-4,6-dideoxy-N-acetyl-beta-L-altrosamine transaminase